MILQITMASRTPLGFIIILLLSINTWASEIQINPTHPDQYTVSADDTLWDISSKFLTHPWQWSELWNKNSPSKPQAIFPGDILYFSITNKIPSIRLSKNTQEVHLQNHNGCVLNDEDFKKGRSEFATSNTGKLLPCIRETTIKQAINLIPAGSVAQFLTFPKVVTENELNHAPYVLDIAGEHLIAGAGDKLYVRSIMRSENPLYSIYRAGDAYISPDTGEILGYNAQYIADTKLENTGDPARLLIIKSNSEIRRGDQVLPTHENNITVNYFPRPPTIAINGSIISVLGGISQIGLHDVVVLDKGTKDGILTGHELTIYQNGKITTDPFSSIKNDIIKLPDEIAGILMIFRPFERVSYALVMKANKAIHILDKVKAL